MMDFEIVSFELADCGQGAPYAVLAYADIAVPSMGMRLNGVRLTWSVDRGYKAAPPRAALRSGLAAVQWRPEEKFAKALCEKLQGLYVAMGGTSPNLSAANANEPVGEDEPFDITLPRFIITGLPA